MLPSDPRVKELTPIQRLWIIGNMNEDYEQQERALNKGSQSVTVDSSGTDIGALQTLLGMAKAHGGSPTQP